MKRITQHFHKVGGISACIISKLANTLIPWASEEEGGTGTLVTKVSKFDIFLLTF